MRVGILTFHSQLNYGGVLQAFALQTALARMGHDPVVIDCWMDVRNAMLRDCLAQDSIRGWVRFALRGLLLNGGFRRGVRVLRTRAFLSRRLRRTPFSFYRWAEISPSALGVDALVVGSDQVWNPRYAQVGTYLLEGTSAGMPPAVGYAVSMGVPSLSESEARRFKEALARFRAVSVREAEAGELLRPLSSEPLCHVADPTLLLLPETWRKVLALRDRKRRRPEWVVYLLRGVDDGSLRALCAAARSQRVRLRVFVGERWQRPCARSVRACLGRVFAGCAGGVRLCLGAGPREFVQAIAEAEGVISDSFHAIMFATLFGKELRILRPEGTYREAMFARQREFLGAYVRGRAVYASLREALEALGERRVGYDTEAVRAFARTSGAWLEARLEGLAGGGHGRNVLLIANADPRVANYGARQRTQLLWKALSAHCNVFAMWPGEETARVGERLATFRLGRQRLPQRILNGVWRRMLPQSNPLGNILLPRALPVKKVFPGVHFDCMVARYAYPVSTFHPWRQGRLFVDVDDAPVQVFDTNANRPRWVFGDRAARWVVQRHFAWLMRHATGAWIANPEQVGLVLTRGKTLPLRNLPLPAGAGYRADAPRKNALMTVGLMGYAPNHRGVGRFLREVWPSVHARWPQLEYWIAGKGAPEASAAEWKAIPGVRVLGFVRDLDALYGQTLATVVPVWSGGGTCIKTLESLSRGRVCLATPFGVRGCDAEWLDGMSGLFVFRSAEQFVALLETVVMEAEERERQEQAARRLAQRAFSFAAFEGSVASLISAPPLYSYFNSARRFRGRALAFGRAAA